MTRTGYPWGMSDTPSDLDYINTKALERFMRTVDYALNGKYGFGKTGPRNVDSQGVRQLMVMVRARMERREQQRLNFWYTFPPLNAIRRLRDSIRLRRYNREWIRKNIQNNNQST
jgi:hypothetical protein